MVTWTQADLDGLRAAVASGVLSVTYAGPPSRTITYQSLASMRALLAEMEMSITLPGGATRHRYVSFNKGFRGPSSRPGGRWRTNDD